MNRHTTTVALGLAMTFAIAVPVFAIVGGEFDADNGFPNVGSIVITEKPDSFDVLITPQTISSATLVHPKVVMTAAHTVALIRKTVQDNANIELNDFAVVFTPDAHDGTGTHHQVAATHSACVRSDLQAVIDFIDDVIQEAGE